MTDCTKCKNAEWDIEDAYGGTIPFVDSCRKECNEYLGTDDCPEYDEIPEERS